MHYELGTNMSFTMLSNGYRFEGMAHLTVYEFTDFRAYLRAWWEREKEQRGRFPKAEVSRLLGLPKSRNYFADVLGGRIVTHTFLERFTQLLALPKDEERFFRALVAFQQAATVEERDNAFGILVLLGRSSSLNLEPEQFEYFRHWWHSAIRALLDTGEWRDEPERIAASMTPSITPGQARKSLRLLEALGLIGCDGSGCWHPTQKSISAPKGIREELLLHLQLQQLEIIKKALLPKTARRAKVATNVVSLSCKALQQLHALIEKAQGEVRTLALSDPQPAEQVVQIVFAAVPLTPKGSRP